ncbi:MAG: hypothetical protein ACRC0I_12500 [Sediminibacterium sp.]|jgi:hypothetical protein|nr:hypothetical protein [Chitinophagaceae bacterium]MCA6447222.1 hypothetical protein [Chitinophagaceae bacterium]
MKIIMILLLTVGFFYSNLITAQSLFDGSNLITKNFFPAGNTTYGYYDGVRLDSLDTKFAVLETSSAKADLQIRRYIIDFGVQASIRRNTITDKNGNPLVFESRSAMLNFFEYNGWYFKQVLFLSSNYGSYNIFEVQYYFERKSQ